MNSTIQYSETTGLKCFYLYLPMVLFGALAKITRKQSSLDIQTMSAFLITYQSNYICKLGRWIENIPACMQSYGWGCHQTELTLPPVKKLKTCFKFPLDGRALGANLQIYTRRLRISHLVICVSLKDLPSSKVPNTKVRSSKNTGVYWGSIYSTYHLLSDVSQRKLRKFRWFKRCLNNKTENHE